MSAIRSLLICLLLSFTFFSCKEETIEPELVGSITGKVFDSQTMAVIEGASLSTSPPSSSVISGSDGTFKIINIPVGSYSVTAEKSGYEKNIVSIAVRSNEATTAYVYLEKKSDQNSAPGVPANPFPESGSTEQSLTLQVSWSASDNDNDTLKYDFYLYKSNTINNILKVTDYADTFMVLNNLEYGTTYFWQVIAKDSSSSANGPLWSFKTKNFPYNMIAYAGGQNGSFDIFTSDSTYKDVVQLTNNISRQWYPRFSPRKNRIAFTSDENGQSQIFTMNYDGSDIQQVTFIPVAGYHNSGIGFCWSASGDYIYYSNYNRLYRINADGSNLTLIANAPADRHFREVAASSLGNKLAVLTVGINPFDSEIYTMNTDGSGMTLFIDNIPGCLGSPEFTLDGTKLMFTRDNSGYEVPDGRQLDSDIMMISLDKADTSNISGNKISGTNDMYPRFSPDGSKIVFTNFRNDNTGNNYVYVMDADGNNRRKIFDNALMPDWK